MGKSEAIAQFIDGRGGVASTAEIVAAGFLPGSIQYAVKQGAIDKVSRGVYCTPDVFEDDFTAVTHRWKKCVFSHETALYLADLSDRVPFKIDVTVPYGYNPQGLKREFPDATIYHVSPKIYNLGIETVRAFGGGFVRAYNAERSVADLIKRRSKGMVDAQIIHDAIGGYFLQENANIHELAQMCKALGVEKQLRLYLEVLT